MLTAKNPEALTVNHFFFLKLLFRLNIYLPLNGFCWFRLKYKEIAVRLIPKAMAASFKELYVVSVFFSKSITNIL